jgi:hypothetical protein
VTVNVCTCEIQLCCELAVLNQLHQLCSSLQLVCRILISVHLYWSCVKLVSFCVCIFLVFLSLLLYSYSQSHYTLFLPTITCSPSEVPLMNKRTTKCFSVLSHINPFPSDFLVFLSLLLYSYSHYHYTLFLPTITCSPSEVSIINKRTTKCCPLLSHISPVPFDYLKAQCHLLEQPKPMPLAQAVYC